MAFYEIVGHDRKMPCYGSAETLADAKKLRDQFFATGKYCLVLIRQYRKNRWGHESYRVLHSLSKRTVTHDEVPALEHRP